MLQKVKIKQIRNFKVNCYKKIKTKRLVGNIITKIYSKLFFCSVRPSRRSLSFNCFRILTLTYERVCRCVRTFLGDTREFSCYCEKILPMGAFINYPTKGC